MAESPGRPTYGAELADLVLIVSRPAILDLEAIGESVKIVKKHETPTRVGGVLGGGVGLATGLVIALFPAAAMAARSRESHRPSVVETPSRDCRE